MLRCLTHSARARTLSILSQLPHADVRDVPQPLRELLPFNSFPVASRVGEMIVSIISTRELSILSQLPHKQHSGSGCPASGPGFQFFPSCLGRAPTGGAAIAHATFNSFPVASKARRTPPRGGPNPRACFQFFPSCLGGVPPLPRSLRLP